MNPELQRAAELAAEYIESFDSQRVSQEPDPQALKARLHKKLTADGLPPLQVIEELVEDARDGLLHSAGRLGDRWPRDPSAHRWFPGRFTTVKEGRST